MNNKISHIVLRFSSTIFISIFLAMAGSSTAYSLEPLSLEEAELFLVELKNDPNPFKQKNYEQYLTVFMQSSVFNAYPLAILHILAICLTERLIPTLLTMTPEQVSQYSQGGKDSQTYDEKIFKECWGELQKKIEKNR